MHPLTLPLLSIEIELEETNKKLQISDHTLNDLEEELGQHENEGRPRGDPLEIDLVKETRSLNHVGKRVSADELRVGMLLAGLRGVGGWGSDSESDDECYGEEHDELEHRSDGKGVRRRRKWKEGMMGEREIQEKIAHLKDSCRALLIMAAYEEKRTKTLIQVVCSLTTMFHQSRSSHARVSTKILQVYQFMTQKGVNSVCTISLLVLHILSQ